MDYFFEQKMLGTNSPIILFTAISLAKVASDQSARYSVSTNAADV